MQLHPTTRTRWAAVGSAGLLTLALAGTGLTAAGATAPAARPGSDAPSAATGQDTSSVVVQLSGAPLSTSTKADRDGKGQLKLQGSKTKSERARLAAERKAFATWLKANAPKARVTSTYDISLNAVAVRLNGTSVDALRAAPGVSAVELQQVFVPLGHDDPDLALIDAPEGWVAAGATSVETDPSTWAGYGVQVGIVDSGVDASHPCFDDAGFPSTAQAGSTAYTNNKMIVARVFNEQAKRLGNTVLDENGHGTHVAGTVACNLHTPAVVEGADIPYDPSGVAPGAQIGSYNVFPGPDSEGRSEDILNALDAAAADGMDVINMSLGGGYHGSQDLLTRAVNNLDDAGIVVAVAAGNEGPGASTTGSPGSAEKALTAGASSVGHYVGVPVLAAGAKVGVAAIGEFPVPETDLTAPLAVVDGLACSAIGEDLTGSIALISRGECSFGTKVANAEAAGAVGVIVVNNVPGDPIAMATDPLFPSTIPAVMVPLADLPELLALDGQDVTLGAGRAYTQTGNDNILMDFSSWGPTRVDYRVKPDVVAPGGNVLSAAPMDFCEDDGRGCWAFNSGTSMATPHLSGMAAVVKDAHGDWTAAQIRSAIANTADVDGVFQVRAITTPETDVQKVGNGLADLDAAVQAQLVFDRTTLSFGALGSGAGKAQTATVTVTNVSNAAVTAPVTVEGAIGPFTVEPASVSLAPGGSATVTVTFAPERGAAAGPAQAHLYVGSSHLALYAYVK